MSKALFFILGLLTLTIVVKSSAEDRYMRYRVLAPSVPTIATISVQSHILSETSWSPLERPGVISNHGLYLEPGVWSPWHQLPGPPTWGTIQLNLKGVAPITSAKVEFQLSTYASPQELVRQFTEETQTGNALGFIIPPGGLLDDPQGVETLPESYERRRRVAELVAIPLAFRPHLLRFGASGVNGNPTIKDSEEYELETARLIGINTFAQRQAGMYIQDAWSFPTVAQVDALKYTPAQLKRLGYLIIADEPGWQSGYDEQWKATGGDTGFRRYLQSQNVTAAFLGKKSLDEVTHISRQSEVAADALLTARRLWYWSCRYTYSLGADYYAGITKRLEAKYPGIQCAANYTDHSILLGQGVAVANPDIFEWGRKRAESMQWSEDWMSAGLNSWGNGMYQKLAFLVDMMRCAGRATSPNQTLGYHVVSDAYAPFDPATDETVSARVNLLLGRGVKTFNFFNYGPTSSSTVDFWADSAPVMRGTADALRLVGNPAIEPYLWAGKPGPTQVCLFYSIAASYWQSQNKTQDDNYEKQLLYCMLAQKQLPADIVDTTDLAKNIKNYKVAYLVDQNIPLAQANSLVTWVKEGGVLALWPQAGSKDEYNTPLSLFPTAVGTAIMGKGRIVRFPERMAGKWWERMVALNKDKTGRPVLTDDQYRDAVAMPALQLAKVQRPVTANAPNIDVRALYSAQGIAVPVVNMRYLFPSEHQTFKTVDGKTTIAYPTATQFPDGCLRYTKDHPATVTLNNAGNVTSVISSRLGNLPFSRQGTSVSVDLALNSTDVLVFAQKAAPTQKSNLRAATTVKPKAITSKAR